MCRSRQELSNEYLLAKFGFDTAENEPCKVCPISAYILLLLLQIPQVAQRIAYQDAGQPAWLDGFQTTFSKDNQLYHKNLRSYFDRDRDKYDYTECTVKPPIRPIWQIDTPNGEPFRPLIATQRLAGLQIRGSKFQDSNSISRELELSNFSGLVLGCIEANFYKY